MKRCYLATVMFDYELCVAIVAGSVKEAKSLAWRTELAYECDSYCDLRVRWLKDQDVGGLPLGMMDNLEAVKREIYDTAECECTICGRRGVFALSPDLDIVCCPDCEDKELELLL